MTLDEFTTLMMGALSGRDPKETLWAVFTVLSQPRGGEGGESLITLGKLSAACKELKVIMTKKILVCCCCCLLPVLLPVLLLLLPPPPPPPPPPLPLQPLLLKLHLCFGIYPQSPDQIFSIPESLGIINHECSNQMQAARRDS